MFNVKIMDKDTVFAESSFYDTWDKSLSIMKR